MKYGTSVFNLDMDLFVIWKGKPQFQLNGRLLAVQKVTHNLEKLKQIHVTRLDIEEAISLENNLDILKDLVIDWEMCQFELQSLWGFKEDSSFHEFWTLPQCQCPVMDNRENKGYYRRIINLGCPLHGRH
jgi:hypothetical protein